MGELLNGFGRPSGPKVQQYHFTLEPAQAVAVLDEVDPALSLDIERYCAPDQFVLLLLTVRFGRGDIAGCQHSAAIQELGVVPVQKTPSGESAKVPLLRHEYRRSQADECIPMVSIRA